MLAPIHKLGKKIAIGLLFIAGFGLASCASHKSMGLVDDPDSKRESQMPWDKQEQWEVGGQLSNVSDRR